MRSLWRLAVVTLFAAGSARATTMLAADVPSLTRSSDAVVRGTVTSVQSRWTGDRMRIVTDVQIEVEESLKGTPPRQVTVVQPGGVVGDIGQRVSGLASFQPGEEVVVFLEKRPGATYRVAGMAQGKFRVERSTDRRAAYAVPESVGDAVLLDPETRQPVEPVTRPVKLEELRRQVLSVARTPPPADPPRRDPSKPLPEKSRP